MEQIYLFETCGQTSEENRKKYLNLIWFLVVFDVWEPEQAVTHQVDSIAITALKHWQQFQLHIPAAAIQLRWAGPQSKENEECNDQQIKMKIAVS